MADQDTDLNRLKALERELDRQRGFARVATAEADRAAEAVENMYGTMGWRERHLGGWLFGDRQLVKSYRSLREEAAALAARKVRAAKRVAWTEAACVKTAAKHLRDGDRDFRRLHDSLRAISRPCRSGARLLRKIDAALQELDEAESMETMDLLTKSKAVSALSHMEVDEAIRAINQVRDTAAVFQSDLKAYGDLAAAGASAQAAVRTPGDTLDLVFDLIGNGGFDFTSLLTLSRLNEAETDLYRLKEQATRLVESLDRQRAATEKTWRERVTALRTGLAQGVDGILS